MASEPERGKVMVGNKRNARLDLLDDELSNWPGSQSEQGAWVRFTDEQPAKRLSVVELETPSEPPRRRNEDDWYLGAYRRYHSGADQKKAREKANEEIAERLAATIPDAPAPRAPVEDKLPPRFLTPPSPEEIAYEEQPTVAMFAQRPRQTQRSGPTREELYREARRLGIEGRSKMNKQQLALALGDTLEGRVQSS
jgi:hypothetical protein